MRNEVKARGQSGAHKREVDLDVVRGIAILLAMGWHINTVRTSSAIMNAILAPGATIGWAGVDLFFVLSGFLIGGAIIRELQKTGGFDFRKFFVRRVFRLWPILYVFLLAMLVLIPARDFFWQSALHIQNFVRTKSATHLWSLAVEEHFYLLVGLGFPLILKRFGWRSSLPIVLVALLVICPLLRALAWRSGVDPNAIQVQTQYRLDALAIGVLLSFYATEKPALFARLLSLRPLWIAGIVAGVAFLWLVPKNTELGSIAGYSVSWIASACALLAIYRSGIELKLGWVAIAISFIGQVSYPLYLWHVPVMKIMEKIGGSFQVPHGFLIVATYAAAIVVSAAMTKFVERPVMRWRDRRFPAKVAAVDTTGASTTTSL